MDPLGVTVTPDDLGAGEFPLPGVFGPPRSATHGAALTPDGEPIPGHSAPAIPAEPETVEGDPDSPDYLIGDWFAPRPHRPLHSTRCVAINKGDGQRCRQWAVIGFERCVKHSGYGRLANLESYRERVIERARLDLIRAAPYAVEALVELSRDTEINPAVRLKASSEVLDRIGVKGGSELDVTIKSETDMSPADVIRARLERLAAASASSPPELPSSAGESVIEAELVEDDDES